MSALPGHGWGRMSGPRSSGFESYTRKWHDAEITIERFIPTDGYTIRVVVQYVQLHFEPFFGNTDACQAGNAQAANLWLRIKRAQLGVLHTLTRAQLGVLHTLTRLARLTEGCDFAGIESRITDHINTQGDTEDGEVKISTGRQTSQNPPDRG
jgi:hypothetical protein